MRNERMMKDIRETVKTVADGVKLMIAVIDIEYPGHGYMAVDVLAEEVDKLRKKGLHTLAVPGCLQEVGEPVHFR